MARGLGLGRKATIKIPSEILAPVEVDKKSEAEPKPRQRTRRAVKLSDVEDERSVSSTEAGQKRQAAFSSPCCFSVRGTA